MVGMDDVATLEPHDRARDPASVLVLEVSGLT